MSEPGSTAASGERSGDIRGIGFAQRHSLAAATAWLDAVPVGQEAERVGLAGAAGRVLARPVVAGVALPASGRAAIDGYAVAAADTAGAGIYNPLPLRVADAAGGGCCVAVSAGSPLPPGADAVLGFGRLSRSLPGRLEALLEAAPGEGVFARACQLPAGAAALPRGRCLTPQDLALIAMLGVTEVSVLRAPRVALLLPGPKAGDCEALAAMLSALVARDGGAPAASAAADLQAALAGTGNAGCILIAGRSGPGTDDVARPALGKAGGRLDLHGIAIRPGDSSGLGWFGNTPLVLLPGAPDAALAAYDLLAGRLVRRLSGLGADLPYPRVALRLARKIVSAVGGTDLVPVAIADGEAFPVAGPEEGGLAAVCRASGFVVVPEAREGYAAGETVPVWLYGTGCQPLYLSP